MWIFTQGTEHARQARLNLFFRDVTPVHVDTAEAIARRDPGVLATHRIWISPIFAAGKDFMSQQVIGEGVRQEPDEVEAYRLAVNYLVVSVVRSRAGLRPYDEGERYSMADLHKDLGVPQRKDLWGG